MSEDVAVRVERGSAWLDREYPGWFNSISLLELNVADVRQCVLAQVFSRHLDEAERLRITSRTNVGLGYPAMVRWNDIGEDARRLGFVARLSLVSPMGDVDALNREWIRVIISRLMGDITMESLEAQVAA